MKISLITYIFTNKNNNTVPYKLLYKHQRKYTYYFFLLVLPKHKNVQVHLKAFCCHMQEQISEVSAASDALCNGSRQSGRALEVDCLLTPPALSQREISY